MPLFKAWDVKRVKRKSVVATHFEEFVTGAKRKLGIDSDEVTIYTEADGTEIDVDSFSEIEAGSILICAVGDETWVPAHGTATTTVSTVVSTSMTVYSNRTSTCSSDPQLSTEPGSTQRSIIIKDGNLKAEDSTCMTCLQEEPPLNVKVVHWIGCDKCQAWHHQFCVGFTDSVCADDVDWKCNHCIAEDLM
ncbi:uncharacterized protein [Acropora muricata]|uniref:uncharacterized protein n=1 Tax=Acropora muricata TaxID=159855 RepID=UPI0034E45ED8